MGDGVIAKEAPPAQVNMSKVDSAVAAAFIPAEAMTAAFIVTYKAKDHRRTIW